MHAESTARTSWQGTLARGIVNRSVGNGHLVGDGFLGGDRLLDGDRLLAHRLLVQGVDHGCVRRLLGGRLHAHRLNPR